MPPSQVLTRTWLVDLECAHVLQRGQLTEFINVRKAVWRGVPARASLSQPILLRSKYPNAQIVIVNQRMRSARVVVSANVRSKIDPCWCEHIAVPEKWKHVDLVSTPAPQALVIANAASVVETGRNLTPTLYADSHWIIRNFLL